MTDPRKHAQQSTLLGLPAKHVSTHSTCLSGSFGRADVGTCYPISVECGARTAAPPRISQLLVCLVFVPEARENGLQHMSINIQKYDTTALNAAIIGLDHFNNKERRDLHVPTAQQSLCNVARCCGSSTTRVFTAN